MKIFFLVTIFLIIVSFFLQAQNIKDTIRVDYSFWGNNYYLGNVKYSKGDISDTLSSNSCSEYFINFYSSNKTFAYITMFGGVFLTYLSAISIGHNRNVYGNVPIDNKSILLLASAVGLELVSLILFIKSANNFRDAIKSYNKCSKGNVMGYNREFRLNLAKNRLVLSYSF